MGKSLLHPHGWFRTAALCSVALLSLTASVVRAQWTPSPFVNTPVCGAPGAQSNSVAVSDGAGGVIVAWVDSRFPTGPDIFAQHLDANGVALWAPDGIPICGALLAQENPAITSDGAGGAIITWQDFRGGISFDIYAQHVTAAGAVTWPVDGALIVALPGAQIWPMLVSDAAGGAIITWEDERLGPGAWDIYAQHITAAGLLAWPPFAGGVPICLAPLGQFMPMIEEDGAGGAIITWYDFRGGIDDDIYAQHIAAGGLVTWAVDGNLVCGLPFAAGSQTQPVIETDGAGGAIITWYDLRSGVDFDIYAQHVSPLGLMTWVPGGVPACVAPFDQELPKLVSDGAGGAIIAWNDARSGIGDNDIYAQHVDALGALLWGPAGMAVAALPGTEQAQPKLVSDGAGGAIIAWNDLRSIIAFDIYAQRVSGAGVALWAPLGNAVSAAPEAQSWAFQFIPVVEDGLGGAIVTWTDARFIVATDIFAQNILADGALGPRPRAFWRFEEGAGTTVGDASGNGNTGSFFNSPTFTSDVPCATVGGRADAYSLNFSPAGGPNFGAVEVPDAPSLRPADGITVEAWIRPAGGGDLVSKQFYHSAPNDVSSFELSAPSIGTGGVRFALADTAGIETEIVALPLQAFPPPGVWTHVAGTWDAGTQVMRVYVNFVEMGSAAFAGPIGYDGSQVLIAASDNGPGGAVRGEFFFGDVDEVRISGRALAPSEMLQATCPLAPLVVVSVPADADTLVAGTSIDIAWTALDDGGVASVMIEFTSDGGASWDTLATGEPNDGSYTWNVPATYSDQCQIRVTAYDGSGNSGSATSLGFFDIVPAPTGVDPRVGPSRLSLSLHPNPFNPSLTVDYVLPVRGRVDVAVFDVQGRRVASLVAGTRPAGGHAATWNGTDARGERAASGVYFIRVATPGGTLVRKAVLLK